MKKSLWVESYRPSKLDDYVWSSPAQKSQVESWIADRSIPHLCLIGSPGLGKTSLALMLLKLLGVEKSDIKFINGCTDNGIEVAIIAMWSLTSLTSSLPMRKPASRT